MYNSVMRIIIIIINIVNQTFKWFGESLFVCATNLNWYATDKLFDFVQEMLFSNLCNIDNILFQINFEQSDGILKKIFVL